MSGVGARGAFGALAKSAKCQRGRRALAAAIARQLISEAMNGPMDRIATLRQALGRYVRCTLRPADRASRAIGNCTAASLRSAYRRRSPDRRIARNWRKHFDTGRPAKPIGLVRSIDIARLGAQLSHHCRKGG
jgi:hypothetical protein